MAEQPQDSKTEEATPRSREKAREEGQVVNSSDLQAAMQLLAGAGLLVVGGEWFVSQLGTATVGYLSILPTTDWSVAHTVQLGQTAATDLQRFCMPFMLVISLVGVFVAVVQAGPIALVPLKLSWERMDPRSGFGRLFSQETTVRGLFAIGKAALITAVAVMMVAMGHRAIGTAGFHSFETSLGTAWDICQQLLLALAGVTLGIGVIDFGFKWYRHEQKLKLSKQDLKDEQKEDTGDPHLRARVRKLQQEATLSKGIKDVPEATVVLTNPTHLAIALKYEHGVTTAPIVLAKGEGLLALRIRRIAEEHGIPVKERKPLVRALYKLVNVGQEVPLEFYQAIAEILSAIYRVRNSH